MKLPRCHFVGVDNKNKKCVFLYAIPGKISFQGKGDNFKEGLKI